MVKGFRKKSMDAIDVDQRYSESCQGVSFFSLKNIL
jgi:hypothetical protein